MVKLKVKELILIKKALYNREHGLKINYMVMLLRNGLMHYMKVNINMEKNMVKVNLLGKTALFMRVTLKMT
jgi:tRNA isopentenyl-2-thiomethyl-A-37 hydroxylase MiaE